MERGLKVKVDLVMWTKNGERTLNPVLNRINQIIPTEFVNQRLIVDDKSVDNTVKIAKSNGWEVYSNIGTGISAGANTALKHVETPFFCSFEQDLLLAPNWWNRISKNIEGKDVAAAEGIRLVNKPSGLRALELYGITKYRKILNNPKGYNYKKFLEASSYGPTLDNTMYKTQILHEMGGFPILPNFGAGTDSLLSKKIRDNNFKWLIDYNVVSTHLRKSLRDEINHRLWCGKTFPIINQTFYSQKITLASLLLRLAFSPLRALEIVLKMKNPSITYIYPIMRLASFKGVSNGYKENIYLQR